MLKWFNQLILNKMDFMCRFINRDETSVPNYKWDRTRQFKQWGLSSSPSKTIVPSAWRKCNGFQYSGMQNWLITFQKARPSQVNTTTNLLFKLKQKTNEKDPSLAMKLNFHKVLYDVVNRTCDPAYFKENYSRGIFVQEMISGVKWVVLDWHDSL